MENLIFSLNATVPVFLMMVLGLFFRKIGWIDKPFALKINTFIFRAALPVLVFRDLAFADFVKLWNTRFVLFCLGVTIISIAAAFVISYGWKDKTIQGEFIQVSYRSSAALLGIAFIQNIYGTSGMAPLMIIASVPLYNVMGVIVLSLFRPGQTVIHKAVLREALKDIITNPIVLGIALGVVWSLLRIQMPYVMEKTVDSLASIATPLGLIAMGASMEGKKVLGQIKPTVAATLVKLIGFTAVFLPSAVLLGFRNEMLVAILIMLGSASTVSCFVMAKNMGHEGVLTSSVIMLTTFFSAFTLTGWLYLLKAMGYI